MAGWRRGSNTVPL
ncbi:unnamed protein product, partial [Didymodactylos carnosus]